MRVSPEEAACLLKAGGVVALPTETVYGLAASLLHPKAVEQIFALKGRPANNPLIVHLADAATLKHYVVTLPLGAEALIEAFWPGPLTMVLPAAQGIPLQVRAGLPTTAFRVPNHPLTSIVLQACGPVVMPSANLSGRPSATRPEHVEEDFGGAFPVLDGGACQRGLESTIVIYRDKWEIARLGALDREKLEPILGYSPALATQQGESPICPGQLYRHYAPRTRLKVAHVIPAFAEGIVLGFSDRRYPRTTTCWALGSLSEPDTVAERLYDLLRRLDEEGHASAWVDGNMPRGGLWDTIQERLHKAAQR